MSGSTRSGGSIIVDSNPLEDISLLADPESSLTLIMKDGKIYKNTL